MPLRPTRDKMTLANYSAVYDYYSDPTHIARYSGRRPIAFATHQALGKLLTPHLSYAPGAKTAIASLVERDEPAIVLCNHVSGWDPNVDQAALEQDPSFKKVLQAYRLWTIAKDSLFRIRGAQRYFDSRNLIPAFRPKNYTDETRRLLRPASARLNQLAIEHLQRGNSVAMYPEGTLNKDDPSRVKRIGDSAAKLALSAGESNVDSFSLLYVGTYYGPEGRTRHAEVHVGITPSETLPTGLRAVRETMQDGMQAAVDGAINVYHTRD